MDFRYVPLADKALDGNAGAAEYLGSPQVFFPTVSGVTTVRVSMDEQYLWVHASIADTSEGPIAPAFQVFFDTARDRASVPQTDDFRFNTHRNNYSYEISGTGTGWSSMAPPTGWDSAVAENPGAGWSAEMRIERSKLGLTTRDQVLGITFAEAWTPADYWWPRGAVWNNPSTWGDAVSSDGWARAVYVSESGDDDTGDGTPSNPFRTIDTAYDAVTSTQTIRIAPGTYAEKVTMESGTWLVGSGSHATTITGNGADTVIVANALTGTPVVSDLAITGGRSPYRGGGMYITSSTIRLQDLVIVGNRADFFGSALGGGVAVLGGTVVLRRLDVANNHADMGGGLFFDGSPNVTITDSVIRGNNSTYGGGGVYVGFAPAFAMTGCTIVGNSSGSGGAGIRAANPIGSSPSGLILWGNSGGADLDGVAVTYSDIEDGGAGIGNLSADPQFATDGIHLLPTSPCIDAIDPGVTYSDRDLDGVPRPQDGNGDSVMKPDMGAFEAPPPMAVNDGAEWTNTRSVTMSSTVNFANMMRTTCGGVPTPWMVYGSPQPCTLPAGDGLKTVQLDCMVLLGHVMSMSDTIKLDSTAPQVVTVSCPSDTLGHGHVSNHEMTFAWSGSDAYSGVHQYAYAFDQAADTIPSPGTLVDSVTGQTDCTAPSHGTWFFHIRAQDSAGNWGAARHLAMIVGDPTYAPVWRFFNKQNGSHFYTASLAEKNDVVANLSAIYQLDGVAYQINTSCPANQAPIYRFYNKQNGSHFYTASLAEKNSVQANLSAIYSYDGQGYRVCTAPPVGSRTVWRFYNKINGSHFYTADPVEKARVQATLAATYALDGPGFYIAQ